MEATWKHVNVFLNAHNRNTNYVYYLCNTCSHLFAAHVSLTSSQCSFTSFQMWTGRSRISNLWSLLPGHASPHSPPLQTSTLHCSVSFYLPYHTQSSRRTPPSFLLKIFLLFWSETTSEPNILSSQLQETISELKSTQFIIKLLQDDFNKLGESCDLFRVLVQFSVVRSQSASRRLCGRRDGKRRSNVTGLFVGK